MQSSLRHSVDSVRPSAQSHRPPLSVPLMAAAKLPLTHDLSAAASEDVSLACPDRGTARGAPDSFEIGSSGISFTETLKSYEIFVRPD